MVEACFKRAAQADVATVDALGFLDRVPAVAYGKPDYSASVAFKTLPPVATQALVSLKAPIPDEAVFAGAGLFVGGGHPDNDDPQLIALIAAHTGAVRAFLPAPGLYMPLTPAAATDAERMAPAATSHACRTDRKLGRLLGRVSHVSYDDIYPCSRQRIKNMPLRRFCEITPYTGKPHCTDVLWFLA